MENPDIYFLKKLNFKLIKHYSSYIFSEELLKYSKYYNEIASYFLVNHVPFPCCHDIYINKNAAIILKVTKVYFNSKKLLFFQVIYETKNDISHNHSTISYKKYPQIKSFFWTSIIIREYIDLIKRMNTYDTDMCTIKKNDINLLNYLEKDCEKYFSQYDENLFQPLLWSNKNSEIINFKKNLPRNILKTYFMG